MKYWIVGSDIENETFTLRNESETLNAIKHSDLEKYGVSVFKDFLPIDKKEAKKVAPYLFI